MKNVLVLVVIVIVLLGIVVFSQQKSFNKAMESAPSAAQSRSQINR